jgi:hypothetical protein
VWFKGQSSYFISMKLCVQTPVPPKKKKIQLRKWEKIFASSISDKGLISRIYISYNSTTKGHITQFKNGQRT